MTKITINGEVFDWDDTHRPMSEALALEAELKTTYAKWEADLKAGSARAMCGFVWLVWRRAGRDVPFAGILSGEVELSRDIVFEEPAGDEVPPDPTGPGEALSGTGAITSPRSASSGSGPGRSGSSPSRSSGRSSPGSKSRPGAD